MPNEILTTQNPNAGHRERWRLRFCVDGLENFRDYEALELLLLYVARQKDMKPIAKRPIEHFGSFQGMLDATQEDLLAIDGMGEGAVTLIPFVKQSAGGYLAQNSRLSVTPEDVSALIDSCRLKMGVQPHEQLHLFGLNANFAIVGDDVIAEGIIDQATVYPRKVIESTIKQRASTLVFVHNYPVGDWMPAGSGFGQYNTGKFLYSYPC